MLVTATASQRGDSYCSLAWGTRLARLTDADAAADVIGGGARARCPSARRRWRGGHAKSYEIPTGRPPTSIVASGRARRPGDLRRNGVHRAPSRVLDGQRRARRRHPTRSWSTRCRRRSARRYVRQAPDGDAVCLSQRTSRSHSASLTACAVVVVVEVGVDVAALVEPALRADRPHGAGGAPP